ncbi:hypothetical protein [Bradyrhizobium pachyrhizi]|uniref:hypothetical protein n=1 Tax=Bradyrhizobium pachyrhizi TaxID=280333 RepID=UPI002AA50FA2
MAAHALDKKRGSVPSSRIGTGIDYEPAVDAVASNPEMVRKQDEEIRRGIAGMAAL